MLLSPMKIGSMTVKNRTVMTAAEFSLGQTNGKPTQRLMDYYEERAKGGVPEISSMVIDIGATSAEEAVNRFHIRIGSKRNFNAFCFSNYGIINKFLKSIECITILS